MAQVCARAADFQATNTEVIIITFGDVSLAQRWLSETCVDVPMLMNPSKDVYSAYGLERSFWGSWGPRTFYTYARLMLSGRRWRGIQGDSLQLGGDFIVDPEGLLRFAYRSRDPSDRPGVDVLLDELNGIQSTD